MLTGVPTSTPGTRFGLGAAIREVAGVGTVVGHDGATPGFHTQVEHSLDLGMTVAVSANSDGRALSVKNLADALMLTAR